MWDRKKRGVEDGSKNFNISNWKNAVAIYLDGEAWNRSLIGEKSGIWVLVMLNGISGKHSSRTGMQTVGYSSLEL